MAVKLKANFKNTAGKRTGMFKGSAPNPGAHVKVHDANYDYAPLAKANPPIPGVGGGPQKMGKA